MEPTCFDHLDDSALDALPFGVVCLSPAGVVERFNRAEAERTGIQRWRALGRDYFRDVAGPAGSELAAMLASLKPGAATRVRHTFRSYHRSTEAEVEAARCEAGRTYLCIRVKRAA
jgi:PAS domain-containing protein